MSENEKVFVVCDANGQCHGVFTSESMANDVADQIGGCYVSEQPIIHQRVQAWHIVEVLEDGTKKHLGTIRTPDAEERAKAHVEKIKKEEGKNVIAERFYGPFTHHAGE